MLSEQNTKMLVLVVGVAVLFMLFNNLMNKKEGMAPITPPNVLRDNDSGVGDIDFQTSATESANSYNKEFNGQISPDMTGGNGYSNASYSDGRRGGSGTLASYYDANNNMIENAQYENGNWVPMDSSGAVDKLSAYQASSPERKELAVDDIFRVDDYLPQERHSDWFEVMPEPISVKNRHLINVSRPVGVNTIGTTLKNATYDIRGAPPNPKFVVGPWMQSTIEPDLNIKGFCN